MSDLDSLGPGRKSKSGQNLQNIARSPGKAFQRLDRAQSLSYAIEMADKHKSTPKSAQSEREARLKAALKANMGRRKAQARARDDGTDKKDS
ncbi:hypothetical protein N9N20_08160 [Planktomarina temperata]|nr:hypothetical protein [Planktomarina temperata]